MSDGTPTPSDDGVKGRLERERSSLTEQLDELASDTDAGLDFDENFADSGQVAAEQGENRALAGSLREQLDDVDAALARLDAGTYGTCSNCGNEINPERREAMPAARYCMNCA